MTLLSLIQLCFSLSVNGFLKFKCDICNRKFEKRTRMIRHIKNMHSMDIHRVDLSKFVLPKKFQQLHPWSLIELWQMAWTPKENNPGGVYRGVRSHPFYRRLRLYHNVQLSWKITLIFQVHIILENWCLIMIFTYRWIQINKLLFSVSYKAYR